MAFADRVSPPPPLPVAEVLRESGRVLHRQWRRLAWALALPAAVALLSRVVAQHFPVFSWGTLAIVPGVALGIAMRIAGYRILLLDSEEPFAPWGVGWTRRETRVLVWIVRVGVGFAALFIVPFVLGFVVLHALDVPLSSMRTLRPGLPFAGVAYVGLVYLSARLSFVVPVAAVDQSPRLEDAWELSRGNGWRLVAVSLVVSVPSLLSDTLIPVNTDGMPIGLAALRATVGIVTTVLGMVITAVAFRMLRFAHFPAESPPSPVLRP